MVLVFWCGLFGCLRFLVVAILFDFYLWLPGASDLLLGFRSLGFDFACFGVCICLCCVCCALWVRLLCGFWLWSLACVGLRLFYFALVMSFDFVDLVCFGLFS